MWICISIIVLAAILVVFYVLQKIKAYSLKAVLLKAFISLLFIVLASYCTYVKFGHVLNLFVIIGLVLGFSGDIWLDLKYVYPKDDKVYSYAGFIVFGIGHVMFITGMFMEFFHDIHVLYLILPLIVGPLVGSLILPLSKPLKLKMGDMKWICLWYSCLLFSTPMTALSLCIAYQFQNTTLLLLFIGGCLFAISDLVLSNTYFAEGHEKPLDFILNYFFYYSAQFVIAFSLFFI